MEFESAIKRLREIKELDTHISYYGSGGDRELVEQVEVILDHHGRTQHSEYEDYGRWSNLRTVIYKITENGETAYFQIMKEVPATESQDGMDIWFSFCEVEPYQVVETKYRQI